MEFRLSWSSSLLSGRNPHPPRITEPKCQYVPCSPTMFCCIFAMPFVVLTDSSVSSNTRTLPRSPARWNPASVFCGKELCNGHFDCECKLCFILHMGPFRNCSFVNCDTAVWDLWQIPVNVWNMCSIQQKYQPNLWSNPFSLLTKSNIYFQDYICFHIYTLYVLHSHLLTSSVSYAFFSLLKAIDLSSVNKMSIRPKIINNIDINRYRSFGIKIRYPDKCQNTDRHHWTRQCDVVMAVIPSGSDGPFWYAPYSWHL